MICIIILVILITVNLVQILDKPLETQELDVKFMIGKTTGFDRNTSLLVFGRVIPGGAITRKVTLDNNYAFPIKIRVLISQELKNFIFAEPEHILLPGETKEIGFNLIPLQDASFGNYSGRVSFEIREYKV